MNLPNLVFGLVAPIGTKISLLETSLSETLNVYGYEVKGINVSNIIQKISHDIGILADRNRNLGIEEKIKYGNKLCELAAEKDFLARASIASIALTEKQSKDRSEKPRAYIVRQLKRPEEIKLLKSVYGGAFIQISANNDMTSKIDSLADIISNEDHAKSYNEAIRAANEFILADANEANVEYGQRISDTFYTADFFIECKNIESVNQHVSRFLKGFFGSNHVSPTRDEYGSYFAKAASLKSIDMSRQVGSAIFTKNGEIVITGCNDVAKAGGGLFWEEDTEKFRDIDIGSEANKSETNRIIYNFLETLHKSGVVSINPEQILHNDAVREAISGSMVADITEYGRMVHAEMNAITDAARLGRPLSGTNMYVTTYPCHTCAKHIIASGISRVVYIEPYPKSRTAKLYKHAIAELGCTDGVQFEHFYGISPSIYKFIFERKKRKDRHGKIIEWQEGRFFPVVDIKDPSLSQSSIEDAYNSKMIELNNHKIVKQSLT